jgi:uncharacterized protein YcbK (DUF882 family)
MMARLLLCCAVLLALVPSVSSGYRSPIYNTTLRQQGRLAAKASLHQYGMAADLIMKGVSLKRIWQDVKALDFGGTGYYQGKTVHIGNS